MNIAPLNAKDFFTKDKPKTMIFHRRDIQEGLLTDRKEKELDMTRNSVGAVQPGSCEGVRCPQGFQCKDGVCVGVKPTHLMPPHQQPRPSGSKSTHKSNVVLSRKTQRTQGAPTYDMPIPRQLVQMTPPEVPVIVHQSMPSPVVTAHQSQSQRGQEVNTRHARQAHARSQPRCKYMIKGINASCGCSSLECSNSECPLSKPTSSGSKIKVHTNNCQQGKCRWFTAE
jgi:hypothetical protein